MQLHESKEDSLGGGSPRLLAMIPSPGFWCRLEDGLGSLWHCLLMAVYLGPLPIWQCLDASHQVLGTPSFLSSAGHLSGCLTAPVTKCLKSFMSSPAQDRDGSCLDLPSPSPPFPHRTPNRQALTIQPFSHLATSLHPQHHLAGPRCHHVSSEHL